MTEYCDHELKNDFRLLRERCANTRALSNEFKSLFSNAANETLTAVAPEVFSIIHQCMIETWWLRASRLMDPAKSMGRQNLSVRNIKARLEKIFGPDSQIDAKWEAINAIWSKMKDARDKQIAHADLMTARQDTWLGELTEAEDECFEDNLQDICDLIGKKLGLGPLDFTTSSCPGDADDLLDFLEFGLRAKLAWEQTHRPESSVRGMYREDER